MQSKDNLEDTCIGFHLTLFYIARSLNSFLDTSWVSYSENIGGIIVSLNSLLDTWQEAVKSIMLQLEALNSLADTCNHRLLLHVHNWKTLNSLLDTWAVDRLWSIPAYCSSQFLAGYLAGLDMCGYVAAPMPSQFLAGYLLKKTAENEAMIRTLNSLLDTSGDH